MTDAEAESAPPSAPVEDKPQPERKVIGGYRESERATNQSARLFYGALHALTSILNISAHYSS